MNNKIKTIQPSGILDSIHGNKLRREIIDLAESGADIILVNLQDITFINSSGIGALVASLKAVVSANKQLYLCSLNDQLKIIFELTRMQKVFKIFNNIDDFQEHVISVI